MVKKTSNNNGQRWKTAEFRGYTTKALQELESDIKEIKTKVNGIDNRIWTMQIKVAGIGAVSAVLVTLVLKFVVGV